MSGPLNSLRQRLRDALDGRTPRERRALAVMAATIVVALWAQLLWSAHHERLRYARLVADLRAQNAGMQQARQAMVDAQAQGPGVAALGADRALAAFAGALRAHGISTVEVLPDASGQVRLAGEAPFDAWIAWLAEAHAQHGVQVLRAKVEPAAQPGMVRIEALLAPARAG